MPKTKASIRTADGHKISNIWTQNGSKDLLVLVHGISSEKTEEGAYTDLVGGDFSKQFDTIMFDFRGHGDSWVASDKTTVSGCALDYLTVLDWAKRQKYSRVFCVASSFGASIVLLTINDYFPGLVKAAVFWNPVISFRNTFIDAITAWGKTYFNQRSRDELIQRSLTRIPESRFKISPLMTQDLVLMHPENQTWPKGIALKVFHGTADSYVPFDDAKRFAEKNGAEFRPVEGVDHGFDKKMGEVAAETRAWLASKKKTDA